MLSTKSSESLKQRVDERLATTSQMVRRSRQTIKETRDMVLRSRHLIGPPMDGFLELPPGSAWVKLDQK